MANEYDMSNHSKCLGSDPSLVRHNIKNCILDHCDMGNFWDGIVEAYGFEGEMARRRENCKDYLGANTEWEGRAVWSGAGYGMCINSLKSLCYDKIDHELDSCCVRGMPRTIPPGGGSVYTNAAGIVLECPLDIVDSTKIPKYGEGLCNEVFMGECPYDAEDTYDRIKRKMETGSFRRSPAENQLRKRTVGGYHDDEDNCGRWLDEMAKLGQYEDIPKKIIKNYCDNSEVLSKERIIENTTRKEQPCRQWCRENPGECDAGAKKFCDQHIKDRCKDAANFPGCVEYMIDPFCSCLYWSERGMPQPQCFSNECEGGVGNPQEFQAPGYKTASMGLRSGGLGDSGCGTYCQNILQLQGTNITVGDNKQSCDIIYNTKVDEMNKGIIRPITEPSNFDISNNEDSSEDQTFFEKNMIAIISFIVFIVVLILIGMIFGGTEAARRRRR